VIAITSFWHCLEADHQGLWLKCSLRIGLDLLQINSCDHEYLYKKLISSTIFTYKTFITKCSQSSLPLISTGASFHARLQALWIILVRSRASRASNTHSWASPSLATTLSIFRNCRTTRDTCCGWSSRSFCWCSSDWCCWCRVWSTSRRLTSPLSYHQYHIQVVKNWTYDGRTRNGVRSEPIVYIHGISGLITFNKTRDWNQRAWSSTSTIRNSNLCTADIELWYTGWVWVMNSKLLHT